MESHTHTHTQTRVTQQSGEVNDYFCLSPHTHTHTGGKSVFLLIVSRLAEVHGRRRTLYDQPALLSADGARTWIQRAAVRSGVRGQGPKPKPMMTAAHNDVQHGWCEVFRCQKHKYAKTEKQKIIWEKKKIELQLFWSFFFSRFAVFLCMAVQFCDYISI